MFLPHKKCFKTIIKPLDKKLKFSINLTAFTYFIEISKNHLQQDQIWNGHNTCLSATLSTAMPTNERLCPTQIWPRENTYSSSQCDVLVHT